MKKYFILILVTMCFLGLISQGCTSLSSDGYNLKKIWGSATAVVDSVVVSDNLSYVFMGSISFSAWESDLGKKYEIIKKSKGKNVTLFYNGRNEIVSFRINDD